MMEKLAKLNRLRLNAGKSELKSWKSSEERLDSRIADLEGDGYVDVVPGANPQAPEVIKDPVVAKARPKPGDLPSKEEPQKEVSKYEPGLGRGLHDEKYAVHSRKAIQDHRANKRKGGKVELSEADKKAIKDEAEFRKGRVDPKKDPEKAKRQADKIAAKQAARKAAGKVSKKKELGKDEVSAADIARSLGIDPKIARAKLRRHTDKIKAAVPKWDGSWVFPKSAEKQIAAILK